MASKFKRRGKISRSKVSRDLDKHYHRPKDELPRGESRCLLTRAGWAHINPHRGCPLDHWSESLKPRELTDLPWSDPNRDIIADIEQTMREHGFPNFRWPRSRREESGDDAANG